MYRPIREKNLARDFNRDGITREKVGDRSPNGEMNDKKIRGVREPAGNSRDSLKTSRADLSFELLSARYR